MSKSSSSKLFIRFGKNFMTMSFSVVLALLFVLVLRSIAVQIAPVPDSLTEPYPDTSTENLCEDAGGRWVDESQVARPYCQGPLQFERERDQQYENNRQISLFVFMIGGAIAAAIALLIPMLMPVAPGLMIGAIVAFFIAGTHIWTLAPGIGRLLLIIIVFFILIGIGLKVFKEET